MFVTDVAFSVCPLTLKIMNRAGKVLWRKSFGGISSRRVNSILVAALSCAVAASAQEGYWINSGGGSWASAGNWDPADGMAGGADNTAYFGFVREASIAPNAAFTLEGPQTIGNLCFIGQGGAGDWSLNAGSGGSLTLDATFEAPQVTVTSPSLQVTLNAAVAGGEGIQKVGPGTLVLAGNNTYSGKTLLSGGGLDVTGLIGNSGVEVAGGALTGTGVIMGPVVVGSGGVLSVGDSDVPLTINNSLTLLPGSTTRVSVNGSGQAAIQGLSSVTFGGTLVVTNLAGQLSMGQSFSIFGSAPAVGNFNAILPPPGPWQRWRFDPATGELSVVSSGSQPVFSSANLNGMNLVIQVTGGPPGSPCYIVASSDLDLPKAEWSRIATNTFDVTGNLTFTNNMSANGAGQLFLGPFVIPSP
jgi:autotransporter-associated beta strand protein